VLQKPCRYAAQIKAAPGDGTPTKKQKQNTKNNKQKQTGRQAARFSDVEPPHTSEVATRAHSRTPSTNGNAAAVDPLLSSIEPEGTTAVSTVFTANRLQPQTLRSRITPLAGNRTLHAVFLRHTPVTSTFHTRDLGGDPTPRSRPQRGTSNATRLPNNTTSRHTRAVASSRGIIFNKHERATNALASDTPARHSTQTRNNTLVTCYSANTRRANLHTRQNADSVSK